MIFVNIHAFRYRLRRNSLRPSRTRSPTALIIAHGRDTFIGNALTGGRTLAELRDAAGHANVSITSAYLHVGRPGGRKFIFVRRFCVSGITRADTFDSRVKDTCVDASEWVRLRSSKPQHSEIIEAAMNLESQYARDESIGFSRLRESIKDVSDDARARIERCVGFFELQRGAVDSECADIDRATGHTNLSQAKKDQLSKDFADDPHKDDRHERRDLQRLLLLEIRNVLVAG